jgi:hypothetical protein
VLVEDNGPIHTSKRSLAALAAREHWLTVEWLPKYAPELNDIEPIWRDLKAHHLAHQTFTDIAALDQAIHDAVIDLNRERIPDPLAAPRISAMKIEWRAACLMHCAHSADTRPVTIFIYNGAPQALVGCLEGPLSEAERTTRTEPRGSATHVAMDPIRRLPLGPRAEQDRGSREGRTGKGIWRSLGALSARSYERPGYVSP